MRRSAVSRRDRSMRPPRLPARRPAPGNAPALPEPVGSDSIAELIGRGVALHCERQWGSALQALLLTGSLARGEATLSRQGRCCRVIGDAEFLAIFDPKAGLPSRPALDEVATAAEFWLQARGCRCAVAIGAAHPRYLRRLPPHIFGFELRQWGRVVLGDAAILSLIPTCDPRALPAEDAWCLLSNRIVEHLGQLAVSAWSGQTPPPELAYSTVKLGIDMATSYLVFAGAYAPSYRERATRLAAMAGAGPCLRAPVPLSALTRLVTQCTDLKLGHADLMDLDWRFWRSVVEAATGLWSWELARMTETEDSPWRAAWQRLARRTSKPRRWRSWAGALRRCPSARSRRALALVTQATPRQLIYRAAYLLLSEAPLIMGSPADASSRHAEEIADCLPILAPWRAHAPTWRELALAVESNYRALLTHTRS